MLKDEHRHGPDEQQVSAIAFSSADDRAEREQQQSEREHEHEGDHVGQGLVDLSGEIDVLGGPAVTAVRTPGIRPSVDDTSRSRSARSASRLAALSPSPVSGSWISAAGARRSC
jgi:hypothetical protein